MNFHLFDQLPLYPVQIRSTLSRLSEAKETQPCEANLLNNSSGFGKCLGKFYFFQVFSETSAGCHGH